MLDALSECKSNAISEDGQTFPLKMRNFDAHFFEMCAFYG